MQYESDQVYIKIVECRLNISVDSLRDCRIKTALPSHAKGDHVAVAYCTNDTSAGGTGEFYGNRELT